MYSPDRVDVELSLVRGLFRILVGLVMKYFLREALIYTKFMLIKFQAIMDVDWVTSSERFQF